jgi:hypothetical protein
VLLHHEHDLGDEGNRFLGGDEGVHLHSPLLLLLGEPCAHAEGLVQVLPDEILVIGLANVVIELAHGLSGRHGIFPFQGALVVAPLGFDFLDARETFLRFQLFQELVNSRLHKSNFVSDIEEFRIGNRFFVGSHEATGEGGNVPLTLPHTIGGSAWRFATMKLTPAIFQGRLVAGKPRATRHAGAGRDVDQIRHTDMWREVGHAG